MTRSMPIMTLLSLTFLLAGALGAARAEAAGKPKDAILILDASGSMWGHIDGVNKIVIAKDVVEGLVRSLPAEQRLGFVAYGHRRKGDCSDIETLADVGAPREDVIKALRGISPRGKTPLSKSVEHAALALNYTKNAATVILVSDGLETCEADPCALARTLEEKGLDLTVHVVGFDVTEKERSGLVCIAEETGGQFVPADNADELAAALTSVAEVTSQGGGEAVPSSIALKATILSGGPLIQSKLDWTVTPASGGDPVFTARGTGPVDTQIAAGDYVANAVWSGWGDGSVKKTGKLAFTVGVQQTKVVTVPIDLALPVTLEAPDATPEGVGFEVTWSGPDDLGAYVHVAGLEDGPRDAIYFFAGQKARNAYASGKAPGDIDSDGDGDFDKDDKAVALVGAPSIAGDYEVRYVLDNPRLILARRPLTVTDSVYTLDVPGKVAVSTEFEIGWGGPLTPGDFVTLIEAGSTDVFQNGVTARLVEGKKATLTTPAVPGDYEVRYILANGYTPYPGMQYAVQASVPLKVTAVAASVSGPMTAVGGSTIEVDWTGPAEGWEDDFISIIKPGAEKYNRDSWDRIVNRDGSMKKPMTIRVPAIGGDYELAYFLQPGGKVISREPITIEMAKAMVDAPDTVKAGTSFTVKYSGDAFKGDRVVVVSADTPDSKMWGVTVRYGFWAEKGGTQGTVSPYPIEAGPGEYEVRYVTGLQHQVLARDRFTVVE